MRIRAWMLAVVLAAGLAAVASGVAAAEDAPAHAEARAEDLQEAAEDLLPAEVLPGAQDADYRAHVSRSEQISAGLATLTGEAVNPLFGVTARSVFVYWRTPSKQRPDLGWYYQPKVWVPLVLILLLMVFKGTICEAVPFLKKPLDALGDLVSKAGAAFSMPLVLAMFADSFSLPAGEALETAWHWLSPMSCAYAAEAGGGAGETFFQVLGWVVSLTLGTAVYVIVWLAFNTIDVLILISPFPAVDAVLKSFRLAVIALIWGLKEWSPFAAVVLSVLLTLACALIAGWSLRLSVFGFIYSTDILLLRSARLKTVGERVRAFSNHGLAKHMPIRSYGSLTRSEDGTLVFTYRPWLVLPRKTYPLSEPPDRLSAGEGLINPYVVRFETAPSESDTGDGRFTTLLRLPPRYQHHEAAVAVALGLSGVRDTSVLRGFRALGRHLAAWWNGEAAMPVA